MRRFRFVGEPNSFDWDQKPVMGDIYPETHFGTKNGVPWRQTFADGVDTNNWQEVFDHVGLPNPLHKDTDLGYFAGLAMQAMLSNPNTPNLITSSIGRSPTPQESLQIIASTAKSMARELIKQLDEENK